MIPNDFSKKKRRSKNSAPGDKFICGCGKTYLSYAALFTHLRNIHDKIPPQGTIIPTNKKEGKRGRPKKEVEKSENNLKVQKEKEESFSSEDDIENALDEFLYYLEQVEKQQVKLDFSFSKKKGSKTIHIQKKGNFRLGNQEPAYDFLDNFPLSMFHDNQEDYMTIYEKLQNFHNYPEVMENYLKHNKVASLDEIFAIFLIKIAVVLKPQFYRDICFFICRYAALMQKEIEKINGSKIKLTTANFMGDSGLNYYLLLNEVSSQIEKRKITFFGDESNVIFHLQNLNYHIRNWIYVCKFSDVEPSFV